MEKSMIIVNNVWDGQPSFKLIPTSIECPFNEVIYSPQSATLAIIAKEQYEKFVTVPKMDEKGNNMRDKRTNQPLVDRKFLKAFYEYEVTGEADIKAVVEYLASNPTHKSYTDLFPAKAKK